MPQTTLEEIISRQLQIALPRVEGAVRLLREGASIPFISRYRKEATGSLDEVQVAAIREQLERLTELEARKRTILETIQSQGALTDELCRRIEECWEAAPLEDLYLPYRPKRRTRATIARERGLEPLADLLQGQRTPSLEREARRFVTAEVPTVEEALAGACDIAAERMAEDDHARAALRRIFAREGVIRSRVVRGKEEAGVKYADYFDASAPLRSIASHRYLAMRRGEEEGFLRVGIEVDAERCTGELCRRFIRQGSTTRRWMEAAVADAFKRLIRPSLETEQLTAAKERADDEAIRIFAENLRQLLLASPLGQKRVIALDPGFRTGCKVVVLDSQGNLLHHTAIFPHPPQNRREEAAATLRTLARRYHTEAFAVGDGTAGRETLQLVRELGIEGVEVFAVSEDGASVYSASATAREEFPDQDVTVRGAISIGRRLIDPLSELVKIDPKSIGVGQYQHSVDQTKLRNRLQAVVESCVNSVGININTASKHILTYVSGLGPALAEKIVAYRAVHGDFPTRRALLQVPRLGARAFEQAAGFLRVVGSENPLDNSAVHPESYRIVERMAKDRGVSVERLLEDRSLREGIEPERYVDERVGLPTVRDILEALDKRGLDPRQPLHGFAFAPDVHSIDDLRPGMVLPGIVTNITAFGAFVDVGVKQDGLVHVSQLANRYVASPADVVRLGQQVEVRVTGVDTLRGRISLSMRRNG
ncbi:RNA-binding transcriptional accessory protein [Alistipes sp. An116]|uniref:Tex family protein n=1 Tax=Alistipes sp. An116 TaxID=1965546 RepID=UPI000B393395|nr:Tex family protein [Alistipes sp. An116]OUQ54081.1 RNA-binding transcriptional accessory protein [Alistipes sp. An116]